jgi:hypothetical protein
MSIILSTFLLLCSFQLAANDISKAEFEKLINENCDYEQRSKDLRFLGANGCISTDLIPNQGDADMIMGHFNGVIEKMKDLKKHFSSRSWFPGEDEQRRVLMSKLIYYGQMLKMLNVLQEYPGF